MIDMVLSLCGLDIDTTPRSLFTAGAVSGLMGTLTSIGSAPMALVYQDATGARMRATLNAFFVVGGLISIAALALAGRFSWHDVGIAVLLTPPAMLGFVFSGWTRRLVDKGQVKRLVLAVFSLSAAILLWRAVF